MIRLITVKRQTLGRALGAVWATALAGAGLLALPVASASAASTSTSSTVAMSYTCLLDASYGNSTPMTITAGLTGPATAPVGGTVMLGLSTSPLTLPPSVSATLPALRLIELVSKGGVGGTSTPQSILYTGKGGPEGAGLATIPAIKATAVLTLDTVGTTIVSTPGLIVITPFDSATGKPLAPIICTASSALSLPITVTGPTPPTSTPTPPPPSGPVYSCAFPGASGAPPVKATFAMSLTATGPGTVGATDRVTLSVPPPLVVAAQLRRADAKALANAKAQIQPAIELKASLPVTGAQTGSIAVSGRNSLNAFTIKATGKLALTTAGTDKILQPPAFQLIAVLPGVTVTLISCTLETTPGPVLLTLKVTGPSAHPAPAAASATPVGAPDTGGGGSLNAAFSLPAAAGGAAALLTGAGLTLSAIRRRKKQHRTAA
jgi:hypothetical protein